MSYPEILKRLRLRTAVRVGLGAGDVIERPSSRSPALTQPALYKRKASKPCGFEA
jgi:hypothetical protein